MALPFGCYRRGDSRIARNTQITAEGLSFCRFCVMIHLVIYYEKSITRQKVLANVPLRLQYTRRILSHILHP